MERNQNCNGNFQGIVDRNEKLVSNENLKYLYSNSHCITHQMKWFKDSLKRG